MFVVHVDQLAFEAPQDALQEEKQIQPAWPSIMLLYVSLLMRLNCNMSRGAEACRTHIVVEVHEVGDDLDVGVVDSGLADDFLQDVTKAGGEDEDRHIVLMQPVEELLIAFPDTKQTQRGFSSAC